jgi:C_GCAxxG_C_C family probable redox protein
MKTDQIKVIQSFREDKNCSQAVLLGFTDRFQILEEHALSISSGFGAGMGRLQKTCGAISGAYMVIGLYAGTKSQNNTERKETAYSMIQEFTRRFEEKQGTSQCSDLLHCDLRSIEGKNYFEDNHLREKVCEKCIQLSLNILDELLEE